jgi:formylglycine-generating enzyme required for sulfatase activity
MAAQSPFWWVGQDVSWISQRILNKCSINTNIGVLAVFLLCSCVIDAIHAEDIFGAPDRKNIFKNSLGIEFVYIPPGSFMMASPGHVVDPEGPKTGAFKAFRGGSCVDVTRLCRSAAGGKEEQSFKSGYLGFRLVYVK